MGINYNTLLAGELQSGLSENKQGASLCWTELSATDPLQDTAKPHLSFLWHLCENISEKEQKMPERRRKQKSDSQRGQQGERSWRCTMVEKAHPQRDCRKHTPKGTVAHGVAMVEQVHPLKRLQPIQKPTASDFLIGMPSVKDTC